ncbi:hypothetical protein [Treponema phagedenis]|uniref:hypothetical protein n=1 Tax=Treponema phagedenis TaxID=162 RepID=UPI0011E83EB3|nr:hypothetical protein [Treponema phagedenis]QEK03087.1 hypothetical protein FUT83_04165 [Treponema phagedenis]QEK08713.1 hypothetical protein FUT81_04150 [Treponema phagedenis]
MKKTNFLVSAALLMVIGLTFVGCGSNIAAGLKKHELWKLQYKYNSETAKNELQKVVDFVYGEVVKYPKGTISADTIKKEVDDANGSLEKAAKSEVLVKIKPAKIVYKGENITNDKYYTDGKISKKAESDIRDLFKLEVSK